MNVSIRKSVGQSSLAMFVAVVLAGCATATGPATMAAANGGAAAPAPAAAEPDKRLGKVAKLVESCLHNAVEEARDSADLDDLLAACIAVTRTRESSIMAAHAALLLLANYGERSIRVFKDEDVEHAGADAALLRLRVEKARAQLAKIRNTPPGADLLFWRDYNAALSASGSDVMLFGVARAALAPVIRRTKVTVRQYITASAGGAAGALEKAFERRETIHRKVQFVKETGRLAGIALTEARCAVEYVDPPAFDKTAAVALEANGGCHDFSKFDGAGKAAAADAHWDQTEQLLKGTIERLDKIINEAAEHV